MWLLFPALFTKHTLSVPFVPFGCMPNLRIGWHSRRLFHRLKNYSTMSLRPSPVQKIPVPSKLTVQLTDTEDRICQLLDDYVSRTQEESSRTICRIAGGWVRDKLLGSHCNDIDIALSNKMGLAFAEGLAAYAKENGVTTGTISKIAQNPEQSKHLETATFKVFDHVIDLVNLRSEEYTTDSRIPSGISFGTPLQDALRRDITINALFFNVHARAVEDFTGKGFDDLRNGFIRTPLPPQETFLDDPLRVLRCIRFASRFGFDIVPEIKEAAKDQIIQETIISKVARERIGEEVAKMMKGRDPLHSIEIIHDFNLYNPIFFALPAPIVSTLSGPPTSSMLGLAAARIFHFLLKSQGQRRLDVPHLDAAYFGALKNDPTCIPRLYLAAALTPYRRITYRDKKNKRSPLVELILRESLKLGSQNHYLDGIPPLFAACDIISPAVSQPHKLHSSERVGIGLLLRDKMVHHAQTGTHWTSSFVFSLIQELVDCYDTEQDLLDVDRASKIIATYNDFAQKINNFGLHDAPEMKTLLDGRQVITVLEAKKPGVWLGEVLAKVVEWQLENPEGTKDDCIQWLQEQRNTGHIRIDSLESEPVNKRARHNR